MTSNEDPSPFWTGADLFTFVFSSGGHAAPNVPFLFVSFQYFSHLLIKDRIVMFKPLGNVFMHRGLGDMVMFRRGPDSSAGFHHVHSQLAGPFLQRF